MTAISEHENRHGVSLRVVKQGRVNLGDAVAPEADWPFAVGQQFLISSFEPPRLPVAMVPRARLHDMLTTAVRERALTLISAPVGAGKSVLAAAWCARRPVCWPVAWLSVGENSEQPNGFWWHLVHAIKLAGVPLDRADRAVLRATDVAFVTALAADLLDREEPLALVVDGFDRIVSPVIFDGLAFLLRHADPKFRLVLSGRGEPRLPIHRYLLNDAMTEIDATALAFTATESRELFAAHGLTMSSSMVEELTQRTGGWAAGLRLAVMSLHRTAGHRVPTAKALTRVNTDDFAAAMAECDEDIAQFLRSEVLEALPERLRDTLTRISVSDQLPRELVDELVGVGEGRRLLADLARVGAFIERQDHPAGSYRVQRVFAEMLRAQLRLEAPAEGARLHGVCTRWFAARGQVLPAVQHAAATDDWPRATALVVDGLLVASLLDPLDPDHESYSNVFASMPVDVVGANAGVVRAALAVGRRDLDNAARYLRDAEELIDSGSARAELALSTAIVCLAVSAGTGAEGGIDLAEQAKVELGRLVASQAAAHPELAALVDAYRGVTLLWSGAEHSAIAAFESAITAFRSPSGAATKAGFVQLRCLNLLAVLYATQGCLRRASELARQQRRAESLGPAGRDSALGALLALAWVSIERCERAAAARWMTEAQAVADRDTDPLLASMLTVVRAHFVRTRGDRPEAIRLLRQLQIGPPGLPYWILRRITLERADTQLACADAAAALTTLQTLADNESASVDALRMRAALLVGRVASADADPRCDSDIAPRVQVDILLARACSHLAAGEAQMAKSSVRHALRIAEPERLRRPFMESTPQIRALIRSSVAQLPRWLNPNVPDAKPVAHPPTSDAPPLIAIAPVEALSGRETEVLRYLAEMLSTEEIAATMFLSVNTVRSHVRNILRKLAAPRRNVAVRRARELRLV